MKFFGDPLPVEVRHPEMLGEHTPQTSATDERFGLAIVTELLHDIQGRLSTPTFLKGSGWESYTIALLQRCNRPEAITETESTLCFHDQAVAPFLSLFEDVVLLGSVESPLIMAIRHYSEGRTRVRIEFPKPANQDDQIAILGDSGAIAGLYVDATDIPDAAAEEVLHGAIATVYGGLSAVSEEARCLALTLPDCTWATHFQDCKRQIWPRVFVTDPEAVKQAMTSAMDARAQVWFVDSENPFVPALTARDSALLQILRSHAAKRDRVSDFRLCIQPGGFLYSGPTTAIPG